MREMVDGKRQLEAICTSPVVLGQMGPRIQYQDVDWALGELFSQSDDKLSYAGERGEIQRQRLNALGDSAHVTSANDNASIWLLGDQLRRFRPKASCCARHYDYTLLLGLAHVYVLHVTVGTGKVQKRYIRKTA
jgi:hypothetical protein